MTSPADRAPRPGSRSVASLQNDSVKLIRSLAMRKVRRETGLFVAEGTALIVTARDHGFVPRLLVHGPGAGDSAVARDVIDWAAGAGADCLDVTGPVLAKIAARDNPQSLIAVFEQRWATVPEPARPAGAAPWVALEGVRDPGNLGSIVRTAEAAGAAGVLLAGASCDPFSHEAVRASMGSVFAVPLARMGDAELPALARAWPGTAVGTHLKGRADFRAVAYRAPVLLVMGTEGDGLTAAAAAACGELVRIPMHGRLDSLNLSVATALMLYEIQRNVLRA
jgi:TrmH family RNA methyltransferase